MTQHTTSAKRRRLAAVITAYKSRHRLNQRLETPQLAVSYQPPAESQYARS